MKAFRRLQYVEASADIHIGSLMRILLGSRRQNRGEVDDRVKLFALEDGLRRVCVLRPGRLGEHDVPPRTAISAPK